MSTASSHNTRPRAAEMLVEETAAHLQRESETAADLFCNEHLVR